MAVALHPHYSSATISHNVLILILYTRPITRLSDGIVTERNLLSKKGGTSILVSVAFLLRSSIFDFVEVWFSKYFFSFQL